jgi:hypothetical protein
MNYNEALKILESSGKSDLDQITKNYRQIIKVAHPDQGGTSAWFIAVRQAYQIILAQYQYVHTSFDGNGQTKQETVNIPEELQKKLSELLDNITDELLIIQIMGEWLWCTGNTYPNREKLKELNFKFSKNKLAWYWHNGEYSKKHHKKYSLDEIESLHGKIKITNKQVPLLIR